MTVSTHMPPPGFYHEQLTILASVPVCPTCVLCPSTSHLILLMHFQVDCRYALRCFSILVSPTGQCPQHGHVGRVDPQWGALIRSTYSLHCDNCTRLVTQPPPRHRALHTPKLSHTLSQFPSPFLTLPHLHFSRLFHPITVRVRPSLRPP